MKAAIKNWAIEYLLGMDDTLVYDDICGDAGHLAGEVNELIRSLEDIGNKLEWTLMADKEPDGEYDYIECYITLKNAPKCVEEYPWNTHHKCFDDKDYDDHAFSADEVLYWLKKPDIDLPDLPAQ